MFKLRERGTERERERERGAAPANSVDYDGFVPLNSKGNVTTFAPHKA